MLIKIIRGTYGLNSGGNIKPKTCNDLPFHVEPAEAERLERLGVAEIVGASAATGRCEVDAERAARTPPDIASTAALAKGTEDETGALSETPPNVPADDDEDYGAESTLEERDVPEYSENNTNAELQAIAKEYGVELHQRANKAQILEALDDFFDGAPEISAKEPE